MKCNHKCVYYQVLGVDGNYKVVCDFKGMTIKDVKTKTPEIYNDCKNYKTKYNYNVN